MSNLHNLSDSQLMNETVKGNQNAFNILVTRHRTSLVNYIAGKIGRDEAEDIAQEALIRAYKAAKKYTLQKAKFKTWLYCIATRLCINTNRNRMRRSKYHVDNTRQNIDNEPLNLIDLATAPRSLQPETAALNNELKDIIYKAIDKLPKEYQTPFLMASVEGYTYEEIAIKLNSNMGTIKSRINRARAFLKDKLQDYYK